MHLTCLLLHRPVQPRRPDVGGPERCWPAVSWPARCSSSWAFSRCSPATASTPAVTAQPAEPGRPGLDPDRQLRDRRSAVHRVSGRDAAGPVPRPGRRLGTAPDRPLRRRAGHGRRLRRRCRSRLPPGNPGGHPRPAQLARRPALRGARAGLPVPARGVLRIRAPVRGPRAKGMGGVLRGDRRGEPRTRRVPRPRLVLRGAGCLGGAGPGLGLGDGGTAVDRLPDAGRAPRSPTIT